MLVRNILRLLELHRFLDRDAITLFNRLRLRVGYFGNRCDILMLLAADLVTLGRVSVLCLVVISRIICLFFGRDHFLLLLTDVVLNFRYQVMSDVLVHAYFLLLLDPLQIPEVLLGAEQLQKDHSTLAACRRHEPAHRILSRDCHAVQLGRYPETHIARLAELACRPLAELLLRLDVVDELNILVHDLEEQRQVLELVDDHDYMFSVSNVKQLREVGQLLLCRAVALAVELADYSLQRPRCGQPVFFQQLEPLGVDKQSLPASIEVRVRPEGSQQPGSQHSQSQRD